MSMSQAAPPITVLNKIQKVIVLCKYQTKYSKVFQIFLIILIHKVTIMLKYKVTVLLAFSTNNRGKLPPKVTYLLNFSHPEKPSIILKNIIRIMRLVTVLLEKVTVQ